MPMLARRSILFGFAGARMIVADEKGGQARVWDNCRIDHLVSLVVARAILVRLRLKSSWKSKRAAIR